MLQPEEPHPSPSFLPAGCSGRTSRAQPASPASHAGPFPAASRGDGRPVLTVEQVSRHLPPHVGAAPARLRLRLRSAVPGPRGTPLPPPTPAPPAAAPPLRAVIFIYIRRRRLSRLPEIAAGVSPMQRVPPPRTQRGPIARNAAGEASTGGLCGAVPVYAGLCEAAGAVRGCAGMPGL